MNSKNVKVAEQQKPKLQYVAVRRCVLRAAKELHSESMSGRSLEDSLSFRRYLSEAVETWVIDRLRLRGETLADFVARRTGTKKHAAKLAELAEQDAALDLAGVIELAQRQGVRL